MNNKKVILEIVVTVLLVSGLPLWSTPKSQAASSVSCQRLSIPAYFYPGPLWDQAIAGSPIVGIMTMNPASGPGAASNPDYVAAVKKAQSAIIRVIGYVHTSYGTRPLADVEAEIDKYKAWYHVNGIFVDEVSSNARDLPYYQKLAYYIRATNVRLVMLNPGTVPDHGYMKAGDIVVVFEGNYSSYLLLPPLPRWVSSYSPHRFSHLIYGVPSDPGAPTMSAAMTQVIDLSRQRNAGHVYVTNDDLPNPWDTLPTYWSKELSNTNCLMKGQ